MFYHPKYYKELRKRNKVARGQGRSNSELTDPASISDQAISGKNSTECKTRSPGPGLKQQAIEETVPHNDIEEASGSSNKQQAEEAQATETQASSSKR